MGRAPSDIIATSQHMITGRIQPVSWSYIRNTFRKTLSLTPIEFTFDKGITVIGTDSAKLYHIQSTRNPVNCVVLMLEHEMLKKKLLFQLTNLTQEAMIKYHIQHRQETRDKRALKISRSTPDAKVHEHSSKSGRFDESNCSSTEGSDDR